MFVAVLSAFKGGLQGFEGEFGFSFLGFLDGSGEVEEVFFVGVL